MFIAIAGTYCSGKTTLVADLANELPEAQAVHDECRPILDVYPEVDWSYADLRNYLLVRQILVEKFVGRSAATMIIDGGVVNNIAHDNVLLQDPPSRQQTLVKLSHNRYDHVFVTDPSGIRIRDDGQRFTDPAMRMRLHKGTIRVARQFGYSPIIISGTREERIASVMSVIGYEY